MPVLLTRKEAAARLGVSLPTLDAERSAGHLTYIVSASDKMSENAEEKM